MATSEFKKLAPGKIETEAAEQVAKEEKFIIDFVKDSYNLYLNDARLDPAKNLEITKNQDKAIALFEEYEFEEKARESERKTDQLNEILDLESEIEKMLAPVISSQIKMPEKKESKLVPRTSGKILDIRYSVPVVKGTVLEVKLIDKKETTATEPEEDPIIEETEEVDDDYLDEFLNEIKRTIEIKETEEGLEKQSEAEKLLSLFKKPEPFFSLQSIKDIYNYFEIENRFLDLLKKVEENTPAAEVEEDTIKIFEGVSKLNSLIEEAYNSAAWAFGSLNKRLETQSVEYLKNIFKKGSIILLETEGVLNRFIISSSDVYFNIIKTIEEEKGKIQATIDVIDRNGIEIKKTIDLILSENLEFEFSQIKQIYTPSKKKIHSPKIPEKIKETKFIEKYKELLSVFTKYGEDFFSHLVNPESLIHENIKKEYLKILSRGVVEEIDLTDIQISASEMESHFDELLKSVSQKETGLRREIEFKVIEKKVKVIKKGSSKTSADSFEGRKKQESLKIKSLGKDFESESTAREKAEECLEIIKKASTSLLFEKNKVISIREKESNKKIGEGYVLEEGITSQIEIIEEDGKFNFVLYIYINFEGFKIIESVRIYKEWREEGFPLSRIKSNEEWSGEYDYIVEIESQSEKILFEKETVYEEETPEWAFQDALNEAQKFADRDIATGLFYKIDQDLLNNAGIEDYLEIGNEEYWWGHNNEFSSKEENKITIEDNVLAFWGTKEECVSKVTEGLKYVNDTISEGCKWPKRNYLGEIIEKDLGNGIGVITSSDSYLWCGSSMAYCFRNSLKKEILRLVMPSTIRINKLCKNTKRDLKFWKINKNNSFFEEYYKKFKMIESYPEEIREEKYENLKTETKEILLKYLVPGNLLLVNTKRRKTGGHVMLCAENIVNFYPENYEKDSGLEKEEKDYILRISVIAYEGDTNDYKATLDVFRKEYYPEEEEDGIWQTTFKKEEYDILNNGLYAVYRFIPEDFVFYSKYRRKKAKKEIANPEIKYIPKG